jgi:amidase
MDVADLAAEWGIELTAEQRADYRTLLAGSRDALAALREADGPRFETLHGSPDRFERGEVVPGDDEHGAWLHRCRIEGAAEGPLSDLTAGVKDNIAVAGVPCTAGSARLAGFVPEIDATAVGRLLAAGATVLGKQNMDAFAMGDTGGLSDFGPARNPVDTDRLAGGSSSGSAAAVAAGDCDAALGTDQAGSVRTPAAWCGIVGLKPTYGAVPYTGAFGMDLGFDHVGILTRSVATNARVLDAVAGEDRQDGCRLDPRQPRGLDLGLPAADGPEGLTVGLVEEGFGRSADGIDGTVRAATRALADRGVRVRSVSVPEHESVPAIVGVAAAVGAATTYRHGGVGGTAPGWHWPRGRAAFHDALRAGGGSLSPGVVHALLAAADLHEREGWQGYAEAKAAALALGRAYDAALEGCDALAMPTSPRTALRIDRDAGRRTRVQRLAELPVNTGGANQTGHPAISVPCGTVDGLPVGLQLIGRRFEESTLYRLADAAAVPA